MQFLIGCDDESGGPLVFEIGRPRHRPLVTSFLLITFWHDADYLHFIYQIFVESNVLHDTVLIQLGIVFISSRIDYCNFILINCNFIFSNQ